MPVHQSTRGYTIYLSGSDTTLSVRVEPPTSNWPGALSSNFTFSGAGPLLNAHSEPGHGPPVGTHGDLAPFPLGLTA
jgi:hypothetical protein